MKKFCTSLTKYSRRNSCLVKVGCVTISGLQPIVVQSMTSTDTNNTADCIQQIKAIRTAGGQIVRLTAQGSREGENLRNIIAELDAQGLHDIGIVADIHFTPRVAQIAAESVDKVRINPGNYNDDGTEFRALLELCRKRGVALRIGVNHGSLAERIVDQHGDTPAGMVVSAMEFLRICRADGFDQVVVSMKSSNVRVMVHAYRLLVVAMNDEGMNYPLHLGVTEAGDGLDGRIKSAAGIGALLADGIGDTIRVSLTEPPENEIPVGKALVDHFASRSEHSSIAPITDSSTYSPYEYRRRKSHTVGRLGGENIPLLYSELSAEELCAVEKGEIALLEARSSNPVAEWRSAVLNMTASGDNHPVILHRRYSDTTQNLDPNTCTTDSTVEATTDSTTEAIAIKAAVDFGALFLDGLADGIFVDAPALDSATIEEISLSILQATRVRTSKTEYIACPGCGRTLYDLQTTLATIKSRTSHLKGLKIGIMGCIVNGPGEMADADYGYVGSGRGRITLYKGKQVIRRDVPQTEAVDALIELIRSCGDWKERE